jgi:hypothetical protein
MKIPVFSFFFFSEKELDAIIIINMPNKNVLLLAIGIHNKSDSDTALVPPFFRRSFGYISWALIGNLCIFIFFIFYFYFFYSPLYFFIC